MKTQTKMLICLAIIVACWFIDTRPKFQVHIWALDQAVKTVEGK